MQKDFFGVNTSFRVITIIVLILCFGFTLTHFSIGVDDEMFLPYSCLADVFHQGQWAYLLTMKIVPVFEYLPFWRDFIALGILFVAMSYWTKIYREQAGFDSAMSTIFSAVVVSFPYITSTFTFMTDTVEWSLMLFLTAVATNIYLNRKRKLDYVYSFLLLVFCFSLFEISCFYFLIACVTIFLSRIKLQNNKDSFNLKEVLLLLFTVFFVAVLATLLSKIGALVVGASGSRLSEIVVYDFSSFASFKTSVCNVPFEIFENLKRSVYNPALFILMVSNAVFVCFSIFCSVKIKNVLPSIMAVLCVLSEFTVFLVTGSCNLPTRHLLPAAFVEAYVFAILYQHYKNTRLKNVVVGLIVIVVLLHSKLINREFFYDYQRYKFDESIMREINTDIAKIDNSKPIVFVGVLPGKYSEMRKEAYKTTIFNWDRTNDYVGELSSLRIFCFFRIHGYNLKRFIITKDNHIILQKDAPKYDYFYNIDPFFKLDSSKLSRDSYKEKISGQIREMPSYPKSGYVKLFDEYIIVKLGASALEDDKRE